MTAWVRSLSIESVISAVKLIPRELRDRKRAASEKMPRRGAEHPTILPGETPIFNQGGANSDARPDAAASLADADMARIVAAWATLPADTKAAILALVDTSH
jgi:hypothetical protein